MDRRLNECEGWRTLISVWDLFKTSFRKRNQCIFTGNNDFLFFYLLKVMVSVLPAIGLPLVVYLRNWFPFGWQKVSHILLKSAIYSWFYYAWLENYIKIAEMMLPGTLVGEWTNYNIWNKMSQNNFYPRDALLFKWHSWAKSFCFSKKKKRPAFVEIQLIQI